jgi:hypothetical protein
LFKPCAKQTGLLPAAGGILNRVSPMQNDLVKKLIWSGLLAGTGALASIAAHRVSVMIWERVFNEDPPD